MKRETQGHAPSLLLSLLVLAACTSQDQPPRAAEESATPAQAEVASAQVQDICAVASADELREATGIEAASGAASTSGAARVCTWAGADGTSAVVQLFQAPGSFEGARAAFEGLYKTAGESVDLGGDAFFIAGVTGQIPTATVAARKGAGTVTVQIMSVGLKAPQLREATERLTRAVLGNL